MIQLFVFSSSASFHRLCKLKSGKRKRGCQEIVIIYFDWLPQLTSTSWVKPLPAHSHPKAPGQTSHNLIKWLLRANEMDLKCSVPASSMHSCPNYLKWHCTHSKKDQWWTKTMPNPSSGWKNKQTNPTPQLKNTIPPQKPPKQVVSLTYYFSLSTESQTGWGGKAQLQVIKSNPLLSTGSTKADWPGLCRGAFWVYSRMETP